MKTKLTLSALFVLSMLCNAGVYFTAPTPANNTNNYLYPFSPTFAATSSMNTCKMEIDSVNYTATVSGGTSCAYTPTTATLLYNHTYTYKGWANFSGTWNATNETRTTPYYSCGNVTGNAVLLADVNVSVGTTCFTVTQTSIIFNGNGKYIRGYTIAGLYYGIVGATNTTIKNFFITNETYGIITSLQANTIDNNTITSCYYGIGMNANLTTISNNTITVPNSAGYIGIYGFGGNLNILNNVISGTHVGENVLVLLSGNKITINNNIFMANTSTGTCLSLNSSANGTVSGNNMTACGATAILTSGATQGFNITGNRISGTTNTGINLAASSANNTVWNNNITATTPASDSGTTNLWNKTKIVATNIIGGADQGGNYYSTYTGKTYDGSGIGFKTFTISGSAGTIDVLPLTNTIGTYPVSRKSTDSGKTWTWGTVAVGSVVPHGSKTSWSWGAWSPESGNNIINGTKTSWSWISE